MRNLLELILFSNLKCLRARHKAIKETISRKAIEPNRRGKDKIPEITTTTKIPPITDPTTREETTMIKMARITITMRDIREMTTMEANISSNIKRMTSLTRTKNLTLSNSQMSKGSLFLKNNTNAERATP
jgi:hypothetical protein